MKHKIFIFTLALFSLATLPTAIAEDYGNIVKNPSFEDAINNWSPAPPNDPTHTFQAIDDKEADGNKALKMQSADAAFQYIYQPVDKGKLLPGMSYQLSVMFKTTPAHLAKINLRDEDYILKDPNTGAQYKGQDFIFSAPGTGKWEQLIKIIKIPLIDSLGDSLADDTWRLYLYAHNVVTPGNSDPIYYDKVELTLIPEVSEETYYLPPFGVINDNKCKSIKFGSGDGGGAGSITYNLVMSDPATDPEVGKTYRSLKSSKYLAIGFPKFNTDPNDKNGIPLSPMLAEVRYKDVSAKPDKVKVWSRIDYGGDDPLKEKVDAYDIGALGKNGYGKWRYVQFGFPLSRFPLIRAMDDGKFYITMMGASKDVPIDYVTLCAVTGEQFNTWKNKQTEALYGFTHVTLPPDAPKVAVNYSDPNLVVFVRDLMKPVFETTLPSQNELKTEISASSAPGEIEPLSFAIYSKNGVADLKLSVSDLINQDTGDAIPAKNIEVKKVVHLAKRLNPYTAAEAAIWGAYAVIPDYLEEFNALLVGADRPERIWLRVHVPENLKGGFYQGKIDIIQGGVVLKTVAMDLDVLPMKLERQAHYNFTYHDPYKFQFTSKIAEAYRLFKETGLDVFVTEKAGDVKQIGKTLNFDISNLETKISKMVSEGLIKDYAMLMIWAFGGSIYTTLFPVAADDQLYVNLSDPKFATAFGDVIKQLNAMADKYKFKFLYNCADEPRLHQNLRILCDRENTIIKANGGLTSVTYALQDESPLAIDLYKGVPGSSIPALTNLTDFKSWAPQVQDAGFAKHYDNYGYYTTNTSYLTYPVYNRFLHGLLPFATDAKFVSAFAMDIMINDPYNDFDRQAADSGFPDVLFAYPTFEGKLLERLNLEGIREGIKDARYIATLKKLILENPDLPVAKEASDYLAALKKKIDPNFWNGYVLKATQFGYYEEIFKNVSPDSDPNDFEAFSKVRLKLIGYIKAILNPDAPSPPSITPPPDTPPPDMSPPPSPASPLPIQEGKDEDSIKTGVTGSEQGADLQPEQGSGGCSLVI